MSGTFSVTISEARGFVAVSAEIDRLFCVIGPTSAGTGMSPFYASGSAAVAGVGYGDAVDTLTQSIEQRQDGGGNGAKYIGAIYTTPGDTPGSYGTIVVSGVTGTAIPSNDTTLAPFGTYELAVRIITGGTVEAGDITYQRSQDAGRNWSNTTALGIGTSIAFPNSGAAYVLGPPSAQVTALIALAVEARSDTLAHLANVVAHDAADTSAAQVALAASSVPTTAAQAWAVLNLCRTALASHETNITVHDGPDPVNVVAHAAATNSSSGVGLGAEYKTDYNAHLGIALASSVAGLKAATATVVGVVVLTTADLLDAGEALLATYPRRITFTTAGATPSDAPATVTIVGTDYAGAAQTETALALAQSAAMVTSTKAFKTITSITYPAADGTGATIAIGYGQGVHNSADVTNAIAAATPTNGTLLAGDTWSTRTFAPDPSVSDVDDAFAAIAASTAKLTLVFLDFPCNAAMAAHVTTGLNTLRSMGKIAAAIIRVRSPNWEASETEAAWAASIEADFANFEDSRITKVASYGLLTDAMTTRQYLRSPFAQVCADFVRIDRGLWPDVPADRAMPNFTLIDATGTTVGHDEGPRGSVTGLSNDSLGNTFLSTQRLPDQDRLEDVYLTVPWVAYAADERIRNLMTRRLCNAIERVALSAATGGLGGKLFYTADTPSTGTLTSASRKLAQSVIYQAVKGGFATEISNADDAAIDTGLVQIAAAVTVSGGNLLGLTGTVNPKVGGFVISIALVLSVSG